MKRTLIFLSVNSDSKDPEDKLTVILEGSKRNVELFQKGMEYKFGLHGWFLGKVIKHRSKQP